MIKIEKTEIKDLYVVKPDVFGDARGWFSETYNEKAFLDAGLEIKFVQDNHSMSAKKGTLRGLHFQNNPHAQTKLIRCTKGAILDVAVDLRVGSPTYLKSYSIELNDKNHYQLLIPRGFAHGFLTLTDDVEVQYKVDNLYNKETDRSVRFNDPVFNINWGIELPILSDKDINAPLYKDSDANFKYEVK